MESCYTAYNKYLISKDKYIKESISDSVEYSYLTYVKQQKKDVWSTEQKQIAKKYAIDHYNDTCIYKINNIRLSRSIDHKLLEIKALKSNGSKSNGSKSNGSKSNGSKSNGSKSNGYKSN
jgi:hypothetical protein